MISDTLTLVRPAVRELKAYQSARSLGIKGDLYLDANESPWPGVVGDCRTNRYPEPQPSALVQALSELYGVKSESLLVGRGSDEAIDVLVRTFCEAGRDAILLCPPTYGVYEVAARLQGAEIRRLPTAPLDRFTVDAEKVLAAWTLGVKLVFLCTPNNPTGNTIPLETLERIAAGLNGKAVLVIDEAYIEFASTPSFVSRLAEHPNVVLLRTLSKAWGLAGVRCGVAIGHPELIKIFQKVRAPYPIPSPAAAVAIQALRASNRTKVNERIETLRRERESLSAALEGSDLIESVYPSEANFLLLQTKDSAVVLERCLARGIVVRDRSHEPGLANAVRVTVGTPAENRRLVDAIRGVPPVQEPVPARRATASRTTKETSITAEVNLDGTGVADIHTGLGYFDHMLEQLSKHGGFDLSVDVTGDLEVDEHHTVEDTALVVGECLNRALADRCGIGRFGFLLPMDESEAKVSLDLSGRPFLQFSGRFNRDAVGELPTELVPHFFRSLSEAMRATLHIEVKGENAHHMVEAIFKAVGRSLRMAIARDPKAGMPSTKGVL